MTRKAPRPKPPTFRSCLECGGQSTGLLCDRCSHRVETPCLRCKVNNAGSTGVCEPCFDAWLKQNEDVFMSPYGAINGFADPLIPPDVAPESTPPRFQRHQWPALPLWPTPRLVASDPPPPGRALLWIGNGLNEWRSVEILSTQDGDEDLVGQTLYMLDSGHIEYASVLGPNAYWLPLPPAPEATL